MRSASLPSVIKAATPRKPAQLVCKETESTEGTVTFTNGVTERTKNETEKRNTLAESKLLARPPQAGAGRGGGPGS